MKKILLLFLLIPALTQAQNTGFGLNYKPVLGYRAGDKIPAEWTSQWTEGTHLAVYPPLSTYQYRIPDCEAWETFTEWAAKNQGKSKCAHDWAVAEWREVNGINLIQTSEMPPPCGKTRHDNEARICRTCLRHETRVRTYGMKEVERKSEYQALLEKINDR